jgi:hypothetical protein
LMLERRTHRTGNMKKMPHFCLVEMRERHMTDLEARERHLVTGLGLGLGLGLGVRVRLGLGLGCLVPADSPAAEALPVERVWGRTRGARRPLENVVSTTHS